MKTPTRKKCGIPWLHADFVNVIGSYSLTKRAFELIARNRFAKAEEKVGAWIGVGNVPKFTFWFAAEFSGELFRRVHLQRQLLVCIEKFDEQGKSRNVGNIAENR